MPGPLASQARAVYRTLIRASNETFKGDQTSLLQFRSIIHQTFLSPTLTPPFKPSSPTPAATSCSPTPTPPPSTSTSSSNPSSSSSSSSSSTPTPSQLNRDEYISQLTHWSDVAKILRENIVQGQRIEKEKQEQRRLLEEASTDSEKKNQDEEEGEAIYRLRLTPHTELGDNSSIKIKPPPIPTEKVAFPNRNAEAREKRKRERERRIREREVGE